MNHLLTISQQNRLKKHASVKPTGEKNLALDAEIAQIKKLNPQAFHNEDSLYERDFYHQPASIVPLRSFLFSYEPKTP